MMANVSKTHSRASRERTPGHTYADWLDGQLRHWAVELRKVEAGLKKARSRSGNVTGGVKAEVDGLKRNVAELIVAAESIWKELHRSVENGFSTLRSSLGSEHQDGSNGKNGHRRTRSARRA